MADLAPILHRALTTAGIPIASVSIGSPTDRAQWTITFLPAATPAQRTQAATIVQTLAIDAAAQTLASQQDAQIQVDAIPLVTKAIVLALIDALNVVRAGLPTPLPPITPAQALAAIRQKAGQL
jgi:hypothetical protein